MTEIMIAVGTRPEIVKMAPLIRALIKFGQQFTFVHCGQHYDYNLSQQFIEEFGLPTPNYRFTVKSSSSGLQISKILVRMEKLILKESPKLLLIEGDTDTVLAAAVAANKQRIAIGHVEAGLRSFDRRMPEEHNRRVVDHLSDYLFAPTKGAVENLRNEHVWGRIHLTGNTVIDAVIQHLPIAESKSEIMDQVRFSEYALATAHRAENVDNPKVLENFVEAFSESSIPIVFPAHPRVMKRLRQYDLLERLSSSTNIQILPPLGYSDFLVLMKNCKLILTDSGGLQEEATAPPIRKLVLVLRLSTERPEAVKAGFAKVVGVERNAILQGIRDAGQWRAPPKKSPFGNGDAGEKIVKIILKEAIYN